MQPTLEIQPFESAHLDIAVELFASGYRGLRQRVPLMPAQWEDCQVVRPLLASMAAQHPMVAAVANGRLVGYLGGIGISEFKGRDNGVYCPEWGHAVRPEASPAERRWIYRRLYETIAETWVGRGLLNQALTILAHDKAALDVWFWSSFGMLCVDVVRGVDRIAVPPEARASALRVRPATPGDVPKLFPIFAEHELYYNRSPIFLPKAPMADDSELLGFLADTNTPIWLAEDRSGHVLGMMKGELNSTDGSTVVRDEGTVTCTGAYVLPAARNRGVGTLLLEALVDWAREHGHARISLDFEAANIHGSRFWLSHFTPVCHSLIRHVDDRILSAYSPRH
jgi:GNAT superfamily N-acetyltransferase